jgi:acetyl-CoA carboxylase carboxyl transferase subunit beta
MNWITKKLSYLSEKIKIVIKKRPTKEEIETSEWTSCCKGPILKKELENNFWVCLSCNKHHRINCRQRFDTFFGKNNYEILETPTPMDDPLQWKDSRTYKDRLKDARKKTGQSCAIMVVRGKINNINITACASDFAFIGGSLGAAEGEAILYAIQHAIENQNPFVNFTSGGGARMFENLIALSQMTRTTLAINELKKNNLPYIVVMCDPTAGGITASYAMLGDLHLSEPDSIVAFAGARVIQATVKEELPEGFQKSEYVQKTGFIDLIVERKDLRDKICSLLSILLKKNSAINSISNETSEDSGTFTKVAS